MSNIQIIQGDITEVEADAIVNAANKTLLGGGGVDGAIHSTAGRELYQECRKLRDTSLINGLPVGEAVATGAYNLSAKYVIHTVGPVYEEDDIEKLKDCYTNCLKIAEDLKCESIAFPAISTGVFRVPIEVSAEKAQEAVQNFPFKHLKTVTFVLFNPWFVETYKQVFGI